MKIYTRRGDRGKTSLAGNMEVGKAELRIETIGSIDLLNSHLGLVLSSNPPSDVVDALIRVQSELFVIGGVIAGTPAEQLAPVNQAQIDRLEKEIDAFSEELPELTNFILPGGNSAAAGCHVARAVCRHAEVLYVRMGQGSKLSEIEQAILIYLNRLSDLLFVAARLCNARDGIVESVWKAR